MLQNAMKALDKLKKMPAPVRHIAGALCILLWLVGSLLPVMPGVVFLAAAIALLAPDLPFLSQALIWLRKKHGKIPNATTPDATSKGAPAQTNRNTNA